MPPPKRAAQFLAMAMKDITALKAMTDSVAFSDEIFGFHAQQAVEKSLKGWIEFQGGNAPITHNLILLLTILEEMGTDVGKWWDLVELNAFAVQYRYEQFDMAEDEIDRAQIILKVNTLISHVAALFSEVLNQDFPD